jgi:hypothetical protein
MVYVIEYTSIVPSGTFACCGTLNQFGPEGTGRLTYWAPFQIRKAQAP